jgi:recombinational DNA repair protein RecR
MLLSYELENRLKKLERQIMACEVCKEKQSEISRILKAYKDDKKKFYIIIAVQMALLLIVSSLGKEGVQFILDATIKKFL